MNNSAQKGLNFFSILTIIFIILKVLKLIDWSWAWVLAPTWIEIILTMILWIICWIKVRRF